MFKNITEGMPTRIHVISYCVTFNIKLDIICPSFSLFDLRILVFTCVEMKVLFSHGISIKFFLYRKYFTETWIRNFQIIRHIFLSVEVSLTV